MLSIEGLRRQVGDFRLQVDRWAVSAGQYCVIVGPSGAGKTMLLEMIAGLHPPDAGRIWLDGRDVTDLAPEARGIGFVYQDYWLFENLTVRQNIDFGRRYRRRAANAPATDALAERLHITGLLERRPRNLSGGERQRVALARALAIRPKLLFLDEPLGTLDPVTRERVAVELRNCHREFGTTTLHVTHDHEEACLMGEAVAVMLDGRLEQTGPTAEVFRRPRDPRLARFLGCQNLFPADAVATCSPGIVRISCGGSTFDVPCDLTGKVTVCVRPEDVCVRPAGWNRMLASPVTETSAATLKVARLPGTITGISDRGPLVRLTVDVAGQSWVSLISRSEQHEHGLGLRDAVQLVVASETVHVMRPDGH